MANVEYFRAVEGKTQAVVSMREKFALNYSHNVPINQIMPGSTEEGTDFYIFRDGSDSHVTVSVGTNHSEYDFEVWCLDSRRRREVASRMIGSGIKMERANNGRR